MAPGLAPWPWVWLTAKSLKISGFYVRKLWEIYENLALWPWVWLRGPGSGSWRGPECGRERGPWCGTERGPWRSPERGPWHGSERSPSCDPWGGWCRGPSHSGCRYKPRHSFWHDRKHGPRRGFGGGAVGGTWGQCARAWGPGLFETGARCVALPINP